MNKKILIILCLFLVAYGIRLWRLRPVGYELHYVVSSVADGESFDVELTVTPHSVDSLVLKPMYHDLHINVSSLKANSLESSQVLTVKKVKKDENMGDNYYLPKSYYHVSNFSDDVVKITYRVSPVAYKVGGACAEIKQYTVNKPGLKVIPSPCLFLIPEGNITAIHVDTQNRAKALGNISKLNQLPLNEVGSFLTQSLLVHGDLEQHKISKGFLELYISPEYKKEQSQKIVNWLTSYCLALEAELGPAFRKLSLLVLRPQGSHELSIAKNIKDFQVSELSLSLGIGKEELAKKLAMRWLGYSPEALFSADAKHWFEIGLAQLATQRALKNIGEDWAGENKLIEAFDVSRSDVPFNLIPQSANTSQTSYFNARVQKAACMALFLDWELQRLSQNKSSIKDVWQFRKKGQELRNICLELVGPQIKTFFDRWIQYYNPLLYQFPFSGQANKFAPVPMLEGEPSFTLIFTGSTQTYLEVCGCKLNQSGGIAKRQTAIKKSLKKSIPSLVVDLGGSFPRATLPGELDKLSEKEISFYLRSMQDMNYTAAVAGIPEILHGSKFFDRVTKNIDLTHFLSADVTISDKVQASKIIDIAGRRLALIGVTGNPMFWDDALKFEKYLQQITYLGEAAISRSVKKAREQGADYIVLMGNVPLRLLDYLDQKQISVDMVLDSSKQEALWQDPFGEHASMYMGYYKDTLIVREGMGSYGLSKLNIKFPTRKGALQASIEYVELNDRVAEDPDLRKKLDVFYSSLSKDPEIWASFKPLFAWDPLLKERSFVGEAQCKQCHQEQHQQWKSTKHSDAMRILVKKHRNFNPKCVVCHVTGMGYSGGFEIAKKEKKHMENVSCEVCHGPGSAHVKAPSKKNIRKTPTKGVCLECHNKEHSDSFEQRFHHAWDAIKH